MLCLAALIVFGILGIFSASHRHLAKEAILCVLRRLAFRPCQAGVGEILKGKIIGWLLRRQSPLAGWAYKHFEILSWIFVILMIVSTVYTARGIYFYARYGTCDPAHPEKCFLTSQPCSPAPHCQPCPCGPGERDCQPPDYQACGGPDKCDCRKSCEGGSK